MLNTNKLAVLCFLGMGALVYGQQVDPYKGKVGINTKTPQATMQVKATEANLAGTTNEGIMAPQLSKTRVAAITTPVEGTLVYVTNETTSPITAYTGADLKVAKIDEKGYYFYNGTEWVKVGASGELWAQRTQNNTTETYLKPATTDNNQFYYHPKGVVTNLGGVTREDTRWVVSGNYGIGSNSNTNEIPLFNAIKSSVLPLNSTIGNNNNGARTVFGFYKNLAIINQDHAGGGQAAGRKEYMGVWNTLKLNDVTSDVESAYATLSAVDVFSNAKVKRAWGVYGEVNVGNDSRSATTESAIGGRFWARNFPTSTTTNLVGMNSTVHNYGGNVFLMNGAETYVYSSSLHDGMNITTYPTVSLDYLRGLRGGIYNRPNSTTKEFASLLLTSNLESGSTANYSYGSYLRTLFEAGSTANTHTMYDANLVANGSATVTDLYGFRLRHTLNTEFKPTNMYGIHLADVKAGTTNNYAIYTNAGNVRIGDLKGTGSRPVYADANGVLKIGATTGIIRKVTHVTGVYTIQDTDDVVVITQTDRAVPITFPTTGITEGRQVTVHGVGSGDSILEGVESGSTNLGSKLSYTFVYSQGKWYGTSGF